MSKRCDLVLPCRDEALALQELLPRVPAEFSVIVVDNGSRDATSSVAERLGATVVYESQAGYGAAVHAGVSAANAELVAVIDGDGSMDPGELPPLLEAVERGGISMAVGRRRPAGPGVWPWHARIGNAVLARWLRACSAVPVHDIAAVRVCRREELLRLDVRDRRFGYPVELLLKAHRAGWSIQEFPVTYYPRARGTKSKVSGSLVGTLRAVRDFARVLS